MNRREGREGREREGERDRERGSRAKPGIQLVYIYTGKYLLSVISPIETNTTFTNINSAYIYFLNN